MLLSEMFAGQPDIEIKGLCIDSRKAQPGDLFFCLKGLAADGHRFAQAACQKGAAAVVHSDDLLETEGVAYVRTDDVNRELNRISDLFYGHPSRRMTVFGVTGTNGKTTTTSIISDVYHKPCGYMGTIAVRYGSVSRIPNLTTRMHLKFNEPDEWRLRYGGCGYGGQLSRLWLWEEWTRLILMLQLLPICPTTIWTITRLWKSI